MQRMRPLNDKGPPCGSCEMRRVGDNKLQWRAQVLAEKTGSCRRRLPRGMDLLLLRFSTRVLENIH